MPKNIFYTIYYKTFFWFLKLTNFPNSSFYCLASSENDQITEYLSKFVENCVTQLVESNCVLYFKNVFQPTALGQIAMKFYISHHTVSMFGENIVPKMSLQDVFELFCVIFKNFITLKVWKFFSLFF